jgi:hypothetical protein
MTDTWNVTGAVTPANPTTGQAITLTISGGDVLTQTVAGTIGPLTLNLTAADGATTTITVPAVPYQQVTSTPESVKITSVSDPSGRLWTVAANGLTASATA